VSWAKLEQHNLLQKNTTYCSWISIAATECVLGFIAWLVFCLYTYSLIIIK
jgi:hypothetical protein